MSDKPTATPLDSPSTPFDNDRVIYLNNAGTSFPKPPEVRQAIGETLAHTPDDWSSVFETAHAETCAFFGIQERERLLFTSGCTSALAVIMNDLPLQAGDRVLTSSLEHHALSRWLQALQQNRGIVHAAAPYRSGQPMDLDWLASELARGDVRLVACTMASNVTGEILPVAEIIQLAHDHDALCLIDAAQTAGLLPIDVATLDADMFVFAGHKGPLAPQGIGALYAAPHVQFSSPAAACDIRAGVAGGCSTFPSYCDVGSVNTGGLSGLTAGLRWLRSRGVHEVRRHVQGLVEHLLAGLRDHTDVTVFGTSDASQRTGAVSIATAHINPAQLAAHMRADDIIVRGGHHCAPMAHEVLGTEESGTLRLSVGPLNQPADIDAALASIRRAIAR